MVMFGAAKAIPEIWRSPVKKPIVNQLGKALCCLQKIPHRTSPKPPERLQDFALPKLHIYH